MAKGISVARFEDIIRLINLGHSDRAIARALKCRRLKVGEIRGGVAKHPRLVLEKKAPDGPLWTQLLDWECVQRELREAHFFIGISSAPCCRTWPPAAGEEG